MRICDVGTTGDTLLQEAVAQRQCGNTAAMAGRQVWRRRAGVGGGRRGIVWRQGAMEATRRLQYARACLVVVLWQL